MHSKSTVKNDLLRSKMSLLNTFQDQEILNAFKLSLINTDPDSDYLTEDAFYNQVGLNFISILRNAGRMRNNELERKLSEMDIHSESQNESSRISDFGDIIPVNFESENTTLRKHQKWSIAEQK